MSPTLTRDEWFLLLNALEDGIESQRHRLEKARTVGQKNFAEQHMRLYSRLFTKLSMNIDSYAPPR